MNKSSEAIISMEREDKSVKQGEISVREINIPQKLGGKTRICRHWHRVRL